MKPEKQPGEEPPKKTEAQANDSTANSDAQKELQLHGEKYKKASMKVKELQGKLGITDVDLPKASKLDVEHKYNYYAQKEREQKRARFPKVTNKEMAVKRTYEIMHKTEHLHNMHGDADGAHKTNW